MKPQLRSYQIDVKNRVRQRMIEGKRVVILQASTGAGKTSVAADITKDAADKGKRVLFLAHRRKLIDQISERLLDFEVDHGVLMRGHRFEKECRIQVASRDTIVSRCIDNQWHGLPPADLIILDEGRHGTSPEYRNLLNNYPSARIILLDATPVMPDGRGLGPWAEAIECAAPTSQLIRDGFLVPVKCYAPERMGDAKKKGKIVKGIAGDLVESWKRYGQNMPTVVFAARVQNSKDAVQMFLSEGIAAAHIDADTPDEDRDRIFDQMDAGKIKVVSNVGIMGEGVDLPCLGCCVFWCNVSGRVRFLQGVGRIMRPYPGKEFAVLIDHAAAVWEHGFPDDDTEWTLEGDVDANFKKGKEEGKVQVPHYCKKCELVYSNSLECPQCGRMPKKPPKSLFAPEEMEVHDEVLTECERKNKEEAREQDMIKHWFRCLGTAANRNGAFSQAGAIWKRKYGKWPPSHFPCQPPDGRWGASVSETYPNFGRKRIHA